MLKSFFWDFPVEMWSDGIVGKFFALCFVSLISVLVWFSIGFVFKMADTYGLDYVKGTGVVQSKKFDPAHTVHWTTTAMVGKVIVTTPHTTHYPDRYFVDINVEKNVDTVQVTLGKFKKVNVNDNVEVKYSKNRFTDGITIGNIY